MKHTKKYGVSMTDCDLFISEDDKIIFEDQNGKQYILQEVNAQ